MESDKRKNLIIIVILAIIIIGILGIFILREYKLILKKKMTRKKKR